jgi:hypothetical protein
LASSSGVLSAASSSHPSDVFQGASVAIGGVLERGDERASLADVTDGSIDDAPEHGQSPGPQTMQLDERARAILDFERESWKLSVAKQRAIRERFGFSAARYHQLLNRLLERPEALAYDPMLVRRLRRLRDVRRRRRTAERLGIHV